jgi:hypothetical protein
MAPGHLDLPAGVDLDLANLVFDSKQYQREGLRIPETSVSQLEKNQREKAQMQAN